MADEGSGLMGGDCGRYCPSFHQTVELLGRRWNGVILHALMAHAERFSEIRAAIPGLSDRLLAERLRELEREGLLSRTCPVSSGAPRYVLTAKGRALEPVIDSISSWASDWSQVAD
ncbi:winged helix-turn-helix transcriptional regulator [Georgenia muralis]|uniref:HxlR family transcriptional regulator n=1 Tax=Georgenia muralis TaxID=154117 RepID=A0A3N4ZYP0_9MICO|nr:winged helix-turn-helix transcriptional regulator [Georgenia muralis]RPF26185.1 HxlR family transcriptional regulator [Georgenia muralis]